MGWDENREYDEWKKEIMCYWILDWFVMLLPLRGLRNYHHLMELTPRISFIH